MAYTAQAVEISEGVGVQAALADVWAVLGDFGNDHIWASQLKSCRRNTDEVRVGTVRYCELAKPLMGLARVEEELVRYEPGRMLAYRLRGSAGPFRSAEGCWRISPTTHGVHVEVSGRFQPRNVVIAFLFGGLARTFALRAARQGLADFTAYVERRYSPGH